MFIKALFVHKTSQNRKGKKMSTCRCRNVNLIVIKPTYIVQFDMFCRDRCWWKRICLWNPIHRHIIGENNVTKWAEKEDTAIAKTSNVLKEVGGSCCCSKIGWGKWRGRPQIWRYHSLCTDEWLLASRYQSLELKGRLKIRKEAIVGGTGPPPARCCDSNTLQLAAEAITGLSRVNGS